MAGVVLPTSPMENGNKESLKPTKLAIVKPCIAADARFTGKDILCILYRVRGNLADSLLLSIAHVLANSKLGIEWMGTWWKFDSHARN